ncbi:MAG: hypothetical protein HY693_01815 [Deltaproteobacteria bacterium]|nr:hypothetical protein [Deltaproteobacteria bacterium]
MELADNKSFNQWLRKNAEKYLLEAAADDLIARYPNLCAKPYREEGVNTFFWRKIFVPIYTSVPWSIRKKIILLTAYPGWKRPHWKKLD